MTGLSPASDATPAPSSSERVSARSLSQSVFPEARDTLTSVLAVAQPRGGQARSRWVTAGGRAAVGKSGIEPGAGNPGPRCACQWDPAEAPWEVGSARFLRGFGGGSLRWLRGPGKRPALGAEAG